MQVNEECKLNQARKKNKTSPSLNITPFTLLSVQYCSPISFPVTPGIFQECKAHTNRTGKTKIIPNAKIKWGKKS